MTDTKPIDQTSGQQRLVESGDSVVDNIGNQIQLVITKIGDFSGNLMACYLFIEMRDELVYYKSREVNE